MQEEEGSALVFLPGAGEITRVAEALTGKVSDDVTVCPLYGQMSAHEQQAAIAPAPEGKRKVVLATNIAETSLTIEGIRLVVDSGLERVARFNRKTGITKLETVQIAARRRFSAWDGQGVCLKGFACVYTVKRLSSVCVRYRIRKSLPVT